MSPPSPRADRIDEPLDNFQSLIELARQGNAKACQRLYDDYAEHVLRVVRRKMSQQLRTIYDSADITQNVWKSFFCHMLPNRTFETPAQLLQFLVGMAQHKVQKADREWFGTRKRSRLREVPLEMLPPELQAGGDKGQVPALQMTREGEKETELKGLSGRERLIVRALRAGHCLAEVADLLSVSVKTIRRTLETYRQRVEEGEEGS